MAGRRGLRGVLPQPPRRPGARPLLHGEDDANVPVGQALYFHRALTQFGVEHDLVIYPREGHSFTERAHQIDVLERVRSWFTRWLGTPEARRG
ncbi:MAG: prolyl oligopeptidase family serine peptidase [Nocardiopsaceae bacterium]|nr:prolyl oligopeptidase family serine peptidase [Nocardiopsaceae bacterium]